jgi:hypothetical protein
MQIDREQIETFVEGCFRHHSKGGYISLRSFFDDASNQVFNIMPIMSGNVTMIARMAAEQAQVLGAHPRPIVFAPLLAVLSSRDHARAQDVMEGLTISIDCDSHPNESRAKLEAILGPATFVVKSGGVWVDPETGEWENKLHLHWRLAIPARSKAALDKLKEARDIATRLVGGDPSGKAVVHPYRWPGTIHRKNGEVMCETLRFVDREIGLEEALAALRAACPAELMKSAAGLYFGSGTDWDSRFHGILTGAAYHDNISGGAMSLINAGTDPGAAVNILRAVMNLSQGPRDDRWHARFNDIPRAVSTAYEKLAQQGAKHGPVIEGDFTVIAGLIAEAKHEEIAKEEPPAAAESKPAKTELEELTHVPGLVGEITDWIEATAVRPNRIIALGAAVTVIGTLIGRRIATPTRSATHLYVAIIADSGAGKQHPMDCIRRLMSAAKAECHVKGPSRLYSLPAVEDLLIANPLCLFMVDELGAFLQSVTNAKAISNVSGISELLRTLWNASFSTVETGFRKGKPGEIIRCPALSTIGMTTKQEFLTALQGASVNNGFMNRHTVLNAETPLVRRAAPLAGQETPSVLVAKLERLYGWNNTMLSLCNPGAVFDPLVVPWGPGAATLWDKIETDAITYQNANPNEANYFRRVAEMSVRLATIRAVGRMLEKATVGVEDLEWGAAIAEGACQYMADAMQDHMPQTARGDIAEKILGYIRRKGPVTPRRIQQQMVRAKIRSQEIQDILKQLVEAGEIEKTTSGYQKC